MKQRLILIITAAAASLLLNACNSKQPAAKVTEEAIVVRTAPVVTEKYAAAIDYAGMLASTKEAKLSFKVGGIIAHMYVKEGDHVSKGQLLATLDLTEINAQVQQALQANDKAKRDMGRVKDLFNDTAATLEQYQNAETQLNVSNENVRIAQFNQQYAQIRATEDGTVIKKIMNEGELAASGTPVYIINGTAGNDWVIRFGVSDKDWAVLKRGDAATVDLDAYPNTTFNGSITKIAEAADIQSGTYEIEVKVEPNGKKFASGLFGTVHLNSSAQQQVAVIPVEALAEADGRKGFVYIPDNNTAKKIPVQIAFIENNRIGIRSGLENISAVITDGVSYLTDSASIKLTK